MSIAIVGVGSVGRRHARNLLALGREDLVLVRSGHGQSGAPEPPLDRLETADSLGAAIGSGVTAVVVANPTALHAATAREAVAAGCHVLIEKPVSHEPAGLADLAREAAERRVAVLVGYQFRFHPTLERVRDLVADGALGELVSAHAHWGEYLPGWHPGEDYRQGYSARSDLGGGVLRTLSHPIDYLRWIAGEVDAATGFSGRRTGLEVDVEDTAVLALRFASGAIGAVTLDYAERPAGHELRLTGTAGSLYWDGISGEATLRRAGGEPEAFHPPTGFERNDMFLAEMRHFLACCAGEETPRCTLRDGVRALEVALAGESA